MQDPNFFSLSSLLLIVLIINILLLGCAKPEVYTVGDEAEWNTGVNYGQWSQKYDFSVGDILVFNYVREQHNAYEVTEDTYRSCNTMSGILNKYESGGDRVELKEARRYWFICSVRGHCLGGMRFGVDVSPSVTRNSTDKKAPSPQMEPIPAAISIKICALEWWSLLATVFTCGIAAFQWHS